jgi:hypothetical protein
MGHQQLRNRMQAKVDDLVASATETGLQIAVPDHGRVVADVVDGIADTRRNRPVTTAVTRNRFDSDLTALSDIDRIITGSDHE